MKEYGGEGGMLTLFMHFVHSVDSADIVVRALTPANDLAAMVLNKIIDTLRTKVQTRPQRKVNLRGKLFFLSFALSQETGTCSQTKAK